MALVTLKSRLPEIIPELEARMDRVTLAVAEGIATEAASRAPVATGELKNSLEAKPTGMQSAAVMAVWYYFFVEFGTKNAGANPFLIPALEAMRGAVLELGRLGLRDL